MAEANPRVEVPSIVQDVVDRCLAKTPDERYGSADWLVEDLERCLSRIAAPSDPTPVLSVPYRELTSEEAMDPRPIRPVPVPVVPPPPDLDPRLRWALAGSATALALVLMGLAAWWMWVAPTLPPAAPPMPETQAP
jgi:serine/threonine protein kinase